MAASGSWFTFILDNTSLENSRGQRKPHRPCTHDILHIRINASRKKDTPCSYELTSEGNTSWPPGDHTLHYPCVRRFSSCEEKKASKWVKKQKILQKKFLKSLHLRANGLSLGENMACKVPKKNGYRCLENVSSMGDCLATMSPRQPRPIVDLCYSICHDEC